MKYHLVSFDIEVMLEMQEVAVLSSNVRDLKSIT